MELIIAFVAGIVATYIAAAIGSRRQAKKAGK